MATDSFQTSSDMLAAPSRAPFAVTPHDSTELSIIPKALYVGTGGTVILRGVGGTADVTFKNVARLSMCARNLSARQVPPQQTSWRWPDGGGRLWAEPGRAAQAWRWLGWWRWRFRQLCAALWGRRAL